MALKKPGKVYDFDADGLDLDVGDKVIVKTVKGSEIGEVVTAPRHQTEADSSRPLKKVVRRANDDDLEKDRKREEAQAKAFETAQEKIVERRLDMRLVEVEQAFDGSKTTFFFMAEDRVDFRDLVKDLAAIFKTRIELRQIGVRDKARMVGGFSTCGQNLCCSLFLSNLNPVSIRMAKDQDLPLNPQKISGVCGRLMCCLRYESEAYRDFKKRAPKRGACVETCQGRKGHVVELNVLRERLKIRDDEGNLEDIALADVKCVCKNGKKPAVEKADPGEDIHEIVGEDGEVVPED